MSKFSFIFKLNSINAAAWNLSVGIPVITESLLMDLSLFEGKLRIVNSSNLPALCTEGILSEPIRLTKSPDLSVRTKAFKLSTHV